MIVRQSILRQSRSSLSGSACRTSRRCQSTEVSSELSPFPALPESLLQSKDEPKNVQRAPRLTSKQRTAQAAQQFQEFQRQKAALKNIGGDKQPHYAPYQLVNNPPGPTDVTLELLLASQSHIGHAASRWNPANAQYIFGVRDGIHIISLDATAAHLRRAARVLNIVARRGGLILFVGTREGQERAVVKAAELSGGYHVFDRWVPGSMTNAFKLLGNCRLKVVDEFDNEVRGFNNQLFDLPPMKPDLVICLNPLENQVLLQECAANNIPTIGVVDTDVNPLWVTYPIPANDDSLRCIALIAGVLGRAGEEGRKFRLEEAKHGRLLARNKLPLEPRTSIKVQSQTDAMMLGGSYKEIMARTRGEEYRPDEDEDDEDDD